MPILDVSKIQLVSKAAKADGVVASPNIRHFYTFSKITIVILTNNVVFSITGKYY